MCVNGLFAGRPCEDRKPSILRSHKSDGIALVVDKLRGCCGQMDIQSHDGKLWIPHNARHAVEAHDRDGKELSKFGTSGKVKARL